MMRHEISRCSASSHSQFSRDLYIRPSMSRFLVRISLLFVLLGARNSTSNAQLDDANGGAKTDISLTEITKAMLLRLGSQFPLAYSSTRVSPTVTQISVKWPTCYGPRHSSILSSFCVPGVEAGNNASASSIVLDVQGGQSSPFTVFIVSDDDAEGQVERFWAAEANNRYSL